MNVIGTRITPSKDDPEAVKHFEFMRELQVVCIKYGYTCWGDIHEINVRRNSHDETKCPVCLSHPVSPDSVGPDMQADSMLMKGFEEYPVEVFC